MTVVVPVYVFAPLNVHVPVPLLVTEVPVPLPSDIDTTSPKYLRDKYAIVGVGETDYMRGSGRTTRALATWAVAELSYRLFEVRFLALKARFTPGRAPALSPA